MTEKLFSALDKLVAWLCKQSTETVLLVCILAVNVIGGVVAIKYALPLTLSQIQSGYERSELQQTKQIETLTTSHAAEKATLLAFVREAMRRGAFIPAPHPDNIGAAPFLGPDGEALQ